MSLSKLAPRNSLPPEVEHLPDGRRAYTRYLEVAAMNQITDDLLAQLALGAVDPFPLFTSSNPARLLKRTIDHNPDGKTYQVQRFEELPATAEIQVGNNTKIQLEDGRSAVEADFLQLVAGSYVAGTVGSTTAPGDSSAFLKDVQTSDDGTVRRIKRTYVYAGTISTSDESLNGGALLRKTIVAAKTAPSTPSGYTPVGTPVQFPNGLPVYTYTFAKGNGEAGRDTDYFQSSDEGTTGGTRITITHLTAASITSDPTSSPGAGYARATIKKEDRDGHRVWLVVWAKGTGIVVTDVDTRNGGKLKVYHRVGFNAAPTTPSATISGTVTATRTSVKEEEGYKIYDYEWAEGNGEISREYKSDLGGDSYFDPSTPGLDPGLLTETVKHLTATSITTNPVTSGLARSNLVLCEKSDEEGYRLWTVIYVKGEGSSGPIIDETEIRNGGKLYLYRQVSINTTQSAPSPQIAGTVVSLGTASENKAGYAINIQRWAEGIGIIGERRVVHEGHGLVSIIRDILNVDDDLSDFDPPHSVLLPLRYEELDGNRRYTAEWLIVGDGSSDVDSSVAVSYATYRPFEYPGRAKTILTTINSTKLAYDVYRSPKVTKEVLARIEIHYTLNADALDSLPATFWNPSIWATIYPSFLAVTGTTGGTPITTPEPLPGYRAVSETAMTFNGGDSTTTTCLGQRVFGLGSGTPFSLAVKGGPEAPGGNAYVIERPLLEPVFMDSDGQQWYRKTIVTAEIPAEDSLPV